MSGVPAVISRIEQRVRDAKTPKEQGDLHREFAAAAKLLHGKYEESFPLVAGWLMSGIRVGQTWAARERKEGRPKKNSATVAEFSSTEFGLSERTCDLWAETSALNPEDIRTYLEDRYEQAEMPSRNGLLHVERAIEKNGALFTSLSPDWKTPKEIVERVVRVLRQIDLDPCSNDGPPNVPARRHFKKKHDGLSQEWTGTVYMNPPYGRVIGDWTGKLISEFRAGRVTQGIALVPSRTDTEWWRGFDEFPVCFIDGRLHFDEAETGAPFPSSAVYMGHNTEHFTKVFKECGGIRPPCR